MPLLDNSLASYLFWLKFAWSVWFEIRACRTPDTRTPRADPGSWPALPAEH